VTNFGRHTHSRPAGCHKPAQGCVVIEAVPSSRSITLLLVLNLAMLLPNCLKSFTIVWSARMFRSTRNRIRFLRPAFHGLQMIWNAVYVLPVPVAITRSSRFCPFATASIAALTAVAR
jgi:hypothetical protein